MDWDINGAVKFSVAGQMYDVSVIINEDKPIGFGGRCFLKIYERFRVRKNWFIVFEHCPGSNIFKVKLFDSNGYHWTVHDSDYTKDEGNLSVCKIYIYFAMNIF